MSLAGLARSIANLTGTCAPRLVALGWATVDLERTLADLGPTAGPPGPTTGPPTPDEPLLGARAALVRAGPSMLVILEPVTEGRLAAALARHGEGVCALYLRTDAPLGAGTRTTALGVQGRLLADDLPWGPFLIEVGDG